MKTFLTLLLPVLVVATFMTSVMLFNNGSYILSAVLHLGAWLSASLWVYILNSRKVAIG
jgi:hypothetical protein